MPMAARRWAVTSSRSSSPVPPGPFHSRQLPVHVTPNKGLHDGDTVTVTASGFAARRDGLRRRVRRKRRQGRRRRMCLNTSSFLNGTDLTADAHGNVTATYAIKRHITTPKNGPLDCATSNVDPDAYDAGSPPIRLGRASPHRATSAASSWWPTSTTHQQSGGTPFSFEGAKFRRLPWQVDASRPRP